MTIFDPKTYTAPFTARSCSQRRPDLDLPEYYCGENPRPEVEGYADQGAVTLAQFKA